MRFFFCDFFGWGGVASGGGWWEVPLRASALDDVVGTGGGEGN